MNCCALRIKCFHQRWLLLCEMPSGDKLCIMQNLVSEIFTITDEQQTASQIYRITAEQHTHRCRQEEICCAPSGLRDILRAFYM